MNLSKFTFTLLFFFGMLFAGAQPALAAKKTKKVLPPKEEQQIFNLPLSQSEIQIIKVVPIERNPRSFELSASSWAPKNFALSSYLSDTSDFNRAGLPLVSANYISKYADLGSQGELSTKVGISYLSLDRTAGYGISASSPQIAHESLNLFSLRLGAEYIAHHALPFHLEPAIGLYILPTWMVASRTELDNGVSAYGFPVEANLDLLYDSQSLSKMIGSADLILGIGIQEVYGSVSGSDMSGFGLQGIFRLRM